MTISYNTDCFRHYDVINITMEDHLIFLTHDTLVLMSYSLICYVLSVVGSNDFFLVLYQLLVISAGYVFATKTTIEYLHRINPHNLYSDKIKPWPDTRDQNPKKNNQLQIEKVIYVVRHIWYLIYKISSTHKRVITQDNLKPQTGSAFFPYHQQWGKAILGL